MMNEMSPIYNHVHVLHAYTSKNLDEWVQSTNGKYV